MYKHTALTGTAIQNCQNFQIGGGRRKVMVQAVPVSIAVIIGRRSYNTAFGWLTAPGGAKAAPTEGRRQLAGGMLDVFLSLFKFTPSQQEGVKEFGLRHGINYTSPCCTKDGPPSDLTFTKQEALWAVDHKRVKVGKGKKAYEATKELLSRWGHFQLGWAEVAPSTNIQPGAPVCVVSKTLFLWIANPLQIMYAEELKTRQTRPQGQAPFTLQRFQFAQGCQHGHVLAGEERFAAEWDQSDDSVWFDIYTISRPAHPISLLTYPVVRYYQGRFKEECAASVARHVQGGCENGLRNGTGGK